MYMLMNEQRCQADMIFWMTGVRMGDLPGLGIGLMTIALFSYGNNTVSPVEIFPVFFAAQSGFNLTSNVYHCLSEYGSAMMNNRPQELLLPAEMQVCKMT